MPDMINPQKGIDLMNNNSIINRILFAVTIFQQGGKYNHHSDKCSNHQKYARVKNHYGWMTSWQWSSIDKKIFQSYHRIHSRVLMHLVVKRFLSSHLVPDRGELLILW
jgi:hypothetical protein